MSAFLGPIHHWLYRKIQFQEELIQTILETARENHWDAISPDALDAACGEMDLRPLEEIIDTRNIHGWLQDKIGVVETRLAFLVTKLLKGTAMQLSDLEQIAYLFGQRYTVGDIVDPSGAFKTLGDYLLDGMPCDHVNVIKLQEENRLVWQQTKCVHHEYWDKVNGNVQIYYSFRTKMMRGMLSGSGWTLHTGNGGLFEIRKE